MKMTSTRNDRMSLRLSLHQAREIHGVSHMAAQCRRADAGGPSTPCMNFYYSTRPFKSGRGTFKHLSVMDAGCTASVIPTRLAKAWGLQIEVPNYTVSLRTADGKQMALDGIIATYCKHEGCPHYRIIRFIVAPCAQEILVSYKDQVRLYILPKSYPCY